MSWSWNDDSSTAEPLRRVPLRAPPPTAAARCCPPRSRAARPATSRCAVSAVVVVLPLVPVIATRPARRQGTASPTSASASDRDSRLPCRHRAAARRAAPRARPPRPPRGRSASRSWPTDLDLDAAARKPGRLRVERRAAPAVRGVHGDPVVPQQPGRGAAAPAESDDRHLAPGAAPLREHHRTLSVASATSAQRMPRIQKRVTTVVSAQPSFSK